MPCAPLATPDRRPSAAVRAWLMAMAAADGYVFVTPEYNHALPAALKDALDFLATEAAGKPVSVVSYSTTAHGGPSPVSSCAWRSAKRACSATQKPSLRPRRPAHRPHRRTGRATRLGTPRRRVRSGLPA
ncbi:NADPH-dependent FMN reductase [Amycolatopsis plumensis]|uniref:NADPH-dependent FMN reductase n=1 Tax=Amycolatopsis plumensis TaxID=236508 RepID=A0ABV5U800_9PSEU